MSRFWGAVAILCVAMSGGASTGDGKPAPKVDAGKLQGKWEGKTKVDLGRMPYWWWSSARTGG